MQQHFYFQNMIRFSSLQSSIYNYFIFVPASKKNSNNMNKWYTMAELFCQVQVNFIILTGS